MKADIVRIVYHYKIETMSRAEAMGKYLFGMIYCDGAESERYASIYSKLAMGDSIIDADDY